MNVSQHAHDLSRTPDRVPKTDTFKNNLKALTPRKHSIFLPLFVITAAVFLLRLPELVNARAIDSDAAIVGLQAMHILYGEWDWHLWGTVYQGIPGTALLALSFLIFGSSPFTWVATLIFCYSIIAWLVFSVVRKRLNLFSGFLLIVPILLAHQGMTRHVMVPSRFLCIAAILFSVWCYDRASSSKRCYYLYALASVAAALSLYFDLFVILYFPGVALFALLCVLDGKPNPGTIVKRIISALAGGVPTLTFFWYTYQTGTVNNVMQPTFGLVGSKLKLLWDMCLPWSLSAKAFVPYKTLHPELWQPPAAFLAVQIIGALLFALCILSGAYLFFKADIPWKIKRLGLLGTTVALTCIVTFCFSGQTRDVWSVRYLTPMILTSGLALVPLTYLINPKRVLLILIPYLISAAVCFWIGYGPYVDGVKIVQSERGQAYEETMLLGWLKERGVRYATAQYWLAYRLTYLWQEEVIVSPLNRWSDRYRPYQMQVDESQLVALIFHPSETREMPEPYYDSYIKAGKSIERFEIEKFTVLLVKDGLLDVS